MQDGFWKGAAAGVVVTGLLALAAIDIAPHVEEQREQRLAEEAPSAAEAPEPETRTVTETVEVEVKVPTFTDACREYVELTSGTVDQIYDYEAAIAPQMGVVYDALGAIIDRDNNALNGVLTDQNAILNDSTGPLQAVTAAKPKLVEARDACLETLEEGE